jgi:hydrogenase maturation protein HypF
MPPSPDAHDPPPAEEIRIRGLVQGVGFRPFIWKLAARFGIRGEVRNDGEGVLIRACGARLEAFIRSIAEEPPPLSRIAGMERRPLDCAGDWRGFAIVATETSTRHTGVTPDATTCPACRAEIAGPGERRHGYAFANCTDCGPRFSIIEAIPYDRAATTMRHFVMCPACHAEYDNPADRRFHAQPIACPDCGPSLSFVLDGAAQPGDALTLAAELIAAGGVLALKGLGGFHLACDATNEAACLSLRQRKRRPHKPFALMAASLDMIRRYSQATEAEARLLAGPAAPIVLIAGKGGRLAASVAPGLGHIGWMLPYTPLHLMLCERLARPLVMTSGNLSGEPQAIGNEEALAALGGFADGFLLHDRGIARRLDDSVAAVVADEMRVLRRARGFAPAPLELPSGFARAPRVLALGGELKSAICFTGGGEALLSHHMGDLEDALSYDEFEKSIADYEALFGRAPEIVACDAHPQYRATQKACDIAAARGLPLVEVQHHHAHIASAMAENGWPADGGPVLGVALDGTGYGSDGTIWGGEFLLCRYGDFVRLGALRPVPLPGGAAAVREPWRNLLAQLTAAFGDGEARERLSRAGLDRRLTDKPLGAVAALIRSGFNSPKTSSAGRLFDAVAAAIGCSFDAISFEGQAAMEAESLARQTAPDRGYPFSRMEAGALTLLDPAPMWEKLLADLEAGRHRATIAARFHAGFAAAACRLAVDLAERHDAAAIALSGGVIQNGLLMRLMLKELAGFGRPVLTQRQVPCNDGGLALGQAVAAAARYL